MIKFAGAGRMATKNAKKRKNPKWDERRGLCRNYLCRNGPISRVFVNVSFYLV